MWSFPLLSEIEDKAQNKFSLSVLIGIPKISGRQAPSLLKTRLQRLKHKKGSNMLTRVEL